MLGRRRPEDKLPPPPPPKLQLWQGGPLCAKVTAIPGVEAPLRTLYRGLNAAHGAALPWALPPAPSGRAGREQMCLAANAWLAVMGLAVAPGFALYWLEQRQRRQEEASRQQAARSRAAASRRSRLRRSRLDEKPEQPSGGGTLVFHLYLVSCMVWAAACIVALLQH